MLKDRVGEERYRRGNTSRCSSSSSSSVGCFHCCEGVDDIVGFGW